MTTLHMVREQRQIGVDVADGDIVVYTEPADNGPLSYRFGDKSINSDALLSLIFRADRVVVW